MGLVRRPTSKTGRYTRWIPIGWSPVPHRGSDVRPEQARFRLKLRVIHEAGSDVDAWAETGEADTVLAAAMPHMEVAISVLFDPSRVPECYYDVAAVLHQTSRHEIEHLLDEGYLAVGGPLPKRKRRVRGQERWQRSVRLSHWMCTRRKLFARGNITARKWTRLEGRLLASASHSDCRMIDYIVSPKELHAFVKGFQAEARYRGVEWDIPMHEYVDSMRFSGKMTADEADAAKTMLVRWAVHVIPHAPITEETLSSFL